MKPEWQAPISVVGVTSICLTYVFVVPGVSALDLCTGAGLGASAMWALTEWEARQQRRTTDKGAATGSGEGALSMSSRLAALRGHASSLVGTLVQAGAVRVARIRPQAKPLPAAEKGGIRRARPAGTPAAGAATRQAPRRRPLIAAQVAANAGEPNVVSAPPAETPASPAPAERAYRPAADVLPRLELDMTGATATPPQSTRPPRMAEVPDEAFSFAPVRPAPEALAQIPAFEAPGASADDVAAEDDMAFEAALRELERQSTPAAREERKAELTATAPILAIDISGDTPAAAADIRPAEAVRREVPAPHAQAGRHSQPAAASRSPEPPLPEAAPVPRQPMAATRRSVRLLEETAWTVAPANDAGPVAVQNEQLVQKIAEDLIIALAERERARDEDARFGAAAEGDGGAAHEPPVSLEDLPFKLEIPDIVRQALARHTEAAPERHSALAAQRNLAPMPLELGRRERIRQELERQQAERRLKRERMEAEQSAYDRDHDGAGHAPQARPASPMPMRRVADRSGTSGPNRA